MSGSADGELKLYNVGTMQQVPSTRQVPIVYSCCSRLRQLVECPLAHNTLQSCYDPNCALVQVHSFGPQVHEKHSFLRNKLRSSGNSFGVVDTCITDGHVFSCGGDGTVKASWKVQL